MSRDSDVKDVAAKVESLLDQLRDNVSALNEILMRPAPGGDAEDERLVQQ